MFLYRAHLALKLDGEKYHTGDTAAGDPKKKTVQFFGDLDLVNLIWSEHSSAGHRKCDYHIVVFLFSCDGC